MNCINVIMNTNQTILGEERMSEPTLNEVLEAIQTLNHKVDQAIQAIHELRDDIKEGQDEIDFIHNQLRSQNKQIWRTERLYKELYKEVKSLKAAES